MSSSDDEAERILARTVVEGIYLAVDIVNRFVDVLKEKGENAVNETDPELNNLIAEFYEFVGYSTRNSSLTLAKAFRQTRRLYKEFRGTNEDVPTLTLYYNLVDNFLLNQKWQNFFSETPDTSFDIKEAINEHIGQRAMVVAAYPSGKDADSGSFTVGGQRIFGELYVIFDDLSAKEPLVLENENPALSAKLFEARTLVIGKAEPESVSVLYGYMQAKVLYGKFIKDPRYTESNPYLKESARLLDDAFKHNDDFEQIFNPLSKYKDEIERKMLPESHREIQKRALAGNAKFPDHYGPEIDELKDLIGKLIQEIKWPRKGKNKAGGGAPARVDLSDVEAKIDALGNRMDKQFAALSTRRGRRTSVTGTTNPTDDAPASLRPVPPRNPGGTLTLPVPAKTLGLDRDFAGRIYAKRAQAA